MGLSKTVTGTFSVPKNRYNTSRKIEELNKVLNMFRGGLKKSNLTPKKKKRKKK